MFHLNQIVMSDVKRSNPECQNFQEVYSGNSGCHGAQGWFSPAKINSAGDASDLLRDLWPVPLNYREAFVSLNLNRANKTVSYALISIGGISATVDTRMIMQHALLSNASSIMIAHNHPSGNLQPSEADIQTTRKIKMACEIMDISLLDHIILTNEPGEFYSFADNCMI